MKKAILIILLLLTACQYFPAQKKLPQAPIIFTGTQAVEIGWTQGTTTSTYIKQQAFFVVELKNKGAYDVKNGRYSFIYQDQYVEPVQGMQDAGLFSLNGKSQYNPQGDSTRITFRAVAKDLPPQTETYQTPVIFQACYPYKTFASAPICIDPDLANTNPRKVCKPAQVALGGGQGAPVTVTKIVPIMVPEVTPEMEEFQAVRPAFEIYLKNSGTGLVMSKDDIAGACGLSAKAFAQEGFNKATITAVLQETPLDCPKEVVLEPGQETMILCDSKKPFDMTTGTFTTLLSVNIEYGYLKRISMPLTITRRR